MTARDDKLSCQACAAPLDPGDGARSGGALRCSFCRAWNRVAGAPPLAGLRSPEAKPRSIRIEDDGVTIRFVRRWFSPVFVALVFFCVIWNGILFVFYRAIFSSPMPSLIALFPILHVAIGAGLTYFTIAGFVNRTVVELEPGRTLSVRHRPLPWPGECTLDSTQITQLFVTSPRRSHDEDGGPSSYTLAALTRDGSRVNLLRAAGLPLEDALYLEQELERRLRIRDEPVIGEVARIS